VASLKHQGEVEVAHAQTAVMQTDLNKAQADAVQLRAQLAAAKTLTTDLQAKLDKAESQLALLQKPAKK